VDIQSQEAALLEGDAAAFAAEHFKGQVLDYNCTTGDKTKPGDKIELKLFGTRKNPAGLKIKFHSTDPENPRFLEPIEADSLPKPANTTVKIGRFTVELKKYVGAVEPQAD
jgi:hypothetical protein